MTRMTDAPSHGQVLAIAVIFIMILLYAVVFFTVLAVAARWDREGS